MRDQLGQRLFGGVPDSLLDTPQERLPLWPRRWASKAQFLQPTGPRAHVVGGPTGELKRSLHQSSSLRGRGFSSRCHVSWGTEGQARSWPCTCYQGHWFSLVGFVSRRKLIPQEEQCMGQLRACRTDPG